MSLIEDTGSVEMFLIECQNKKLVPRKYARQWKQKQDIMYRGLDV